MIKKILENFFRIFLVVCILATYILEPCSVSAKSTATTLAGLRNELSTLQAQKKKQQNSIKATESEIQTKNNQIASAYSDIETAENDIEIAKNKIEESNKEIDSLKDKAAELLKFYELMTNNEEYMEYVSGASTMTELIMRSDAVNAIVNYTNENITALEETVNENENLKVELLTKENELEKNIETYQNKIESLENDLSALMDVSMDIDDQITAQKALISYYEKLGCGETQDLDECVNQSNNKAWLKPLTKGKISSLWGWRISPITHQSSLHSGVDIAGNAEGTSVYSIGTGVVAVVVDATSKYYNYGTKTCGGNQVYVNMTIEGVKYTILYAHLLKANVKVGDTVTSNTIIGLQGGGSATLKWETCSTGTHLHFGVSKGYYKNYTSFMAGQINPPGYPGKGAWFTSRTQWFN